MDDGILKLLGLGEYNEHLGRCVVDGELYEFSTVADHIYSEASSTARIIIMKPWGTL